MDRLPDLPGLESERANAGEGCNPLVGCALLVFAPVGGVIIGARWYSVVGLMLLVIGSALLCYYLTDRVIETDGNGITSRKRIAQTHIAWSDVESATTAEKSGCQAIIIKSGTGRSVVAPVGADYSAVIEASVWQHLRRVGRAGNIRLSGGALSLWCEIPDSVPVEMELGPESQPKGDGESRYSITRDYIAQWLTNSSEEPTTIPWSKVTSVWWESENFDKEIWLHIEADGQEVIVDLKKDNPEAARFFLAAVRRGRSVSGSELIVIPEEYREFCVMPE